MTKTCPSCDVLAPPDARFCRHCGAPLQRPGATTGTEENVSPIAATVPLSGHNPTDEIVAHPAAPPIASHTSEVTREEMDDLLQRGERAGEVVDGAVNPNGDKQLAPARDAHGAASHHAESLDADDISTHDTADHFDSEQTQITIPVRPLTARNSPADAAASVASIEGVRADHKPQFNSAPRQVTLSPTGSLHPAATQTMNAAPPRLPAQANETRAFRVWLGIGAGMLLLVVVGAVLIAAFWFGSRAWRAAQDPPAAVVAGGEIAPATNDPLAQASAKLAEAEALLASGNATEAMARLREAVALDPANAEAQRRLARLLLASGERREGIEALRAVTRLVPTDAEAWQSLASAQFAEGLYEDALESYRGLGEASPATLARDPVQLAYADALRMSGRLNEARVIYRRLATSPDAEVAAASKQQLAQPTPSPTNEAIEEAQALETTLAQARVEASGRTPEASDAPAATPPSATRAEPTATPLLAPSNSLSPAEHYGRGVSLWAKNRGAAVTEFRVAAERGNSDASYYLGLSIAEGRDPRALNRAELVAALVHFGRARRGKFRAPSAIYEEQLGRELDRRRNQQSSDK